MLRHVLPNILGPTLVVFTLEIAHAKKTFDHPLKKNGLVPISLSVHTSLAHFPQ